jgi:hypothetical protein
MLQEPRKRPAESLDINGGGPRKESVVTDVTMTPAAVQATTAEWYLLLVRAATPLPSCCCGVLGECSDRPEVGVAVAAFDNRVVLPGVPRPLD